MYIYTCKDKDDNTKLFNYHYKVKNTIYLRYRDRNCRGTAKIESGEQIKINNECNLEFEDHSYIKYKIAYEKVESNNYSEEDIKKHIFQKAYYQYSYDSFPQLSYDDITINLVENILV